MTKYILLIFSLIPLFSYSYIGDEDYLEWDEPVEVKKTKILENAQDFQKEKEEEEKKKLQAEEQRKKKEAEKQKAAEMALKEAEEKKNKLTEENAKKPEEPAKLTIALPFDYPPYSYLGKDKNLKGLYIKLFEAINLRMGNRMEFRAMGFDNGQALAKDGIIGFVGLYKNKEREKVFDFSESIFGESIVLYTLKDKTFDFENFASLRGKTIGLVEGYSYGDQFDKYKARKFFAFRYAKNENGLFDLLLENKVQVILCDDIIANKILFQREIGNKIEKLNRTISNMKIYMVWGKGKAPENFFKEFNYNLAVIQTNGVYSKILSNFIRTSFMED